MGLDLSSLSAMVREAYGSELQARFKEWDDAHPGEEMPAEVVTAISLGIAAREINGWIKK